MESSLTKACTIKIQNFEGPLDLLYHLIEKNQMNLYDIPINDITDQYMEYLFGAQEMDLEIASEFLVMAATLLHIKSKMLLPEKKEKAENEVDPREELVIKLIEYKKYKEFTQELKSREKYWDKVYYKLPEAMEFSWDDQVLELSPEELERVIKRVLDKSRSRVNKGATKMAAIIQHEKVSLKSKIKDVVMMLISKPFFKFTELFSLKTKSKTEVVTGFMAILELSKLKKAKIVQERQFSDIYIYRNEEVTENVEGDGLKEKRFQA